MSNLNQSLRTHLIGSTNISNTVGVRVFPVGENAGIEKRPMITFQVISATHPRSLTVTAGYTQTRVQINCEAMDSTTVQTLAGYVRNRLHNFRGAMGTAGNQLTVRGVQLENEDTEFAPLGDGSEKVTFVHRQDYMITYLESEPTYT